MTALKKQASALVLTLAAASGAMAGGYGHGGGSIPECSNGGNPNNGCQVPVTQPSNTYNNNAAKAEAEARAIAAQKQAQQQAQQQGQQQALTNNNTIKVNTAGGTGIGGAGGSVGDVSSTGGTVGNVGSNSVSSSNNGGISNTTTYKEAKQIGIAPPVYVSTSGDCGTGFSLSTGFVGGAVGGGWSGPQRLCLSENTMMKIAYLGRDLNDDGIIIAALGALAETNPEFKNSLQKAGVAFTASCATTVAKRTRVLAVGLTEEKCKTMLYSFSGAAVVPAVTAPAVQPVVPAVPPCGGSKVAVYNANLQQWKCGRDLK